MCWLLFVVCCALLLVVCGLLLVVCDVLLFVVCGLLSVVDWLLFVVCCASLLVAVCRCLLLLLIVGVRRMCVGCCVLFAAVWCA